MRHDLGIRLDHVGEAGFQEFRRLPVVLLAGSSQQRAVGSVLDQRVLEDVSGAWRAAALVEKLGLDQLPEAFLENGLAGGGEAGNHFVGELAAQHRAELGELADLRQAVEPPHQRFVQGVRVGQ